MTQDYYSRPFAPIRTLGIPADSSEEESKEKVIDVRLGTKPKQEQQEQPQESEALSSSASTASEKQEVVKDYSTLVEVNRLINEALEKLKVGNPMGALMLVAQAEGHDVRVKDLSYLRGLIMVDRGDFLAAKSALELELQHYPHNTEAAEMLRYVVSDLQKMQQPAVPQTPANPLESLNRDLGKLFSR